MAKRTYAELKAIHERYNASEKGKARSHRYDTSVKGKARSQKWGHSEKGQQSVKRRVRYSKREFGRAKTPEQAAALNTFIKERIRAFKQRQPRYQETQNHSAG